MFKTPLIAASILLGLAQNPSAAQSPSQLGNSAPIQVPVKETAASSTILSLDERAEREVDPDQLRASLSAQATADTAAKAQASVNAQMEKALAKVKGQGFQVETGRYFTYQDQPPTPQGGTKPPMRWRAGQTLTLVGADVPKLLEAVTDLQEAGLALQNLNFEISRAKRRTLEDDLTAEAIQRLQARAEFAARAMGLSFAGWRSVTLGNAPRPEAPMMRAYAASAGAPMQAKVSAEPAPILISYTVNGEAILK